MTLRRRRAGTGFTILELSIVLIVISLTATLSIWAYFSRAEVTLVNAARLLVEDLRMAQMRAVCNHSPVEVVFDRESGCYYVTGVDDPSLPTREKPRCYQVDAVFEGVRLGEDTLGRPAIVTYDARGRSTRTARLTLCYRSDARTILVPEGESFATILDEPAPPR